MRIVVTGARGQLGFDCIRELKERGYSDIIAIDKDDLDLTDEKAVKSFIIKTKPDVVMHNAAWTMVDEAEKYPELVKKINVDAAKYLAESAENVGAKIVYISTDYIFPGAGNKYYEINDTAKPLSVYGQSKFDGEKAVSICKKSFIVRISWAFGINGNNFVKTMLKLGKTNLELAIVSDQIGSPTYTRDLSKLLCDMIETDKYGIYHATNEGVCSWADFAKEIFKHSNLDVTVLPISTKEYLSLKPNQATRPLNSRLSKKSLDDAGFRRLPSWQDALKRFLKELQVI